MKTITEFSGFTLKEAINKKAALITEGKTEEEAQAAISEQLKLADETKVSFYKNAVDMSKSRIDQVKRVVVAVKSSETEKVPEAFSEREGNFYLVEFFSQGGAMARGREDSYDDRGRGGRGGRGGSGGDRGRGGNDRGRGGPGGGRGGEGGGGRGPGRGGNDRGERPAYNADRAPRGDRPAPSGAPSPFVVNPADPNFKPKHAPQAQKKPRPPKGPRPERAPRDGQGPKGAAELRLVLKGQSQSTLQGSGPATAAPAEGATSSETQQG